MSKEPDIKKRISSRCHPAFRNLMILRNQIWGGIPPTDEVFDFFERVRDITNAKKILEIGVSQGLSSSIQLEVFSEASLVGYDVTFTNWWHDVVKRNKKNTFLKHFGWPGGTKDKNSFDGPKSTDLLKVLYGDRFTFKKQKSREVIINHDVGDFDMAFIDGDHTYEGVNLDIVNCKKLRIPYLIIDNILSHPDAIMRAIGEHFELELIDELIYSQVYPITNEIIKDSLGFYKVNYNV
jgi:predicted O-methyltransferase YrrM